MVLELGKPFQRTGYWRCCCLLLLPYSSCISICDVKNNVLKKFPLSWRRRLHFFLLFLQQQPDSIFCSTENFRSVMDLAEKVLAAALYSLLLRERGATVVRSRLLLLLPGARRRRSGLGTKNERGKKIMMRWEKEKSRLVLCNISAHRKKRKSFFFQRMKSPKDILSLTKYTCAWFVSRRTDRLFCILKLCKP